MRVFQVLEFYPYEGYAEPTGPVYSTMEAAEARATELRLRDPGHYDIFELEVV